MMMMLAVMTMILMRMISIRGKKIYTCHSNHISGSIFKLSFARRYRLDYFDDDDVGGNDNDFDEDDFDSR